MFRSLLRLLPLSPWLQLWLQRRLCSCNGETFAERMRVGWRPRYLVNNEIELGNFFSRKTLDDNLGIFAISHCTTWPKVPHITETMKAIFGLIRKIRASCQWADFKMKNTLVWNEVDGKEKLFYRSLFPLLCRAVVVAVSWAKENSKGCSSRKKGWLPSSR